MHGWQSFKHGEGMETNIVIESTHREGETKNEMPYSKILQVDLGGMLDRGTPRTLIAVLGHALKVVCPERWFAPPYALEQLQSEQIRAVSRFNLFPVLSEPFPSFNGHIGIRWVPHQVAFKLES